MQDIGGKERKSMKTTNDSAVSVNKVKYTDESFGDVKIIQDFLPSPKDLIPKEENVKVTISLTKVSVEFFKNKAKKYHTQYQKMIRNLLDLYASNHSRKLANL